MFNVNVLKLGWELAACELITAATRGGKKFTPRLENN